MIAGGRRLPGSAGKERCRAGSGQDLGAKRLRIAILPWGDVIEDYLDPIGLSFDDFRIRIDGGWLFGYADALLRAGAHPFVVCVSRDATETERLRHEPSGVPLWRLPQPSVARALRARRSSSGLPSGLTSYLSTPPVALADVLRRTGCDRILCQEYEYPRFDVSVALGRCLGVPVFATFQGGDFRSSRFEAPFRPLAIRGAAGFVVATRREAGRLRDRYGVSPGRIARVANPLSLDQWKPESGSATRDELGVPQDARVVAWHGRVDMRPKGLDVLLAAWERVERRDPDGRFRLLAVGSGPDEDRFRRETRTLERVIRVDRFVTNPGRVRALLAAADLYVFPSRHEGFAVAPLEAMACELPVVAARTPAIEEVLASGDSAGGVLVPPEDPAALAAALWDLLTDDDRRRRLGAAARRRVEELASPESVGRRLLAFLSTGRVPPPGPQGLMAAR